MNGNPERPLSSGLTSNPEIPSASRSSTNDKPETLSATDKTSKNDKPERPSGSESATTKCTSIFSPPPLLPGEDRMAYDATLGRIFGAVNPSDVLEELWVQDMADRQWMLRRWRCWLLDMLTSKMKEQLERSHLTSAIGRERFLAGIPPLETTDIEEIEQAIADDEGIIEELLQRWAAKDPSAIKRVDELLALIGRTMEGVRALSLERAISIIGSIDGLCASAERARNSAFRELNRHRDSKAFRRSLNAVREIEDTNLRVETKSIAPNDQSDEVLRDQR